MLVIGLVGGMGSGKTTVAEILSSLGAEVIHADLVGHEAYRPGTAGFAAVVDAFGDEIVGDGGTIDRRRLGARVFSEPGALDRLNSILHPLIRAEIERRIDDARRANRTRAVVVEAAILLEAGWRSLVDQVWVVSASRDQVVMRLEHQRGMNASDVDARLERQLSDTQRRAAADRLIENQGTPDELRRAVSELWRDATAHGAVTPGTAAPGTVAR